MIKIKHGNEIRNVNKEKNKINIKTSKIKRKYKRIKSNNQASKQQVCH